MTLRTLYRSSLELVGFVAALAAFDALWPGDPGFQSLGGLPYFLVPAIFAGVYGWPGALSGSAASLGAVALTVALGEGAEATRFVPGALGGLYIAGAVLFLRRTFLMQRKEYRARFRDLVARNHRLSRENLVLTEVCKAAESRIAMDRRSLSLLVSRLNALDQGSLASALQGLLGLVQSFVGVEKASVWRHEPRNRRLVLVAAEGWSGREWPGTEVAADGTLLGWVCRNGEPFSLRMGVDQEHFAKLDQGGSLLASPVRIGDRVWGVLSVEAMPFVRYSRQAEDILDVILKLAEKSLKPIFEREELFVRQETDGATGLPQASLLLQVLAEEATRASLRGGALSLVLVELANGPLLEDRLGSREVAALLAQIAGFIPSALGMAVPVFLSKHAHQLAFYLADRDRDGTALTCLGLLGDLQRHPWVCADEPVSLEILVGYGTLAPGSTAIAPLIEDAERLLEMQRI